MSDSVFITILPYFFALFCAFCGIIWRNLNEKIKMLEKNICDVPAIQMQSDISMIKNDIQWIKNIVSETYK